MEDRQVKREPIARAVEYLRDNDTNEDGLEGELADELVALKAHVMAVLESCQHALTEAAMAAGDWSSMMASGDADAINETWNEGGRGFMASEDVEKLKKLLNGGENE